MERFDADLAANPTQDKQPDAVAETTATASDIAPVATEPSAVQEMEFAAEVIRNGEDALLADEADIAAATAPARPLAPVVLTGRLEAEAMFAAITGKLPTPAVKAAEEDEVEEEIEEESAAAAAMPAPGRSRGSADAAAMADTALVGLFSGTFKESRSAVRQGRALREPTAPATGIFENQSRGQPPAPRSADHSMASAFLADDLTLSAGATPVAQRGPTGAWWTLPLMFAGLAIIACALLVPAADQNRQAAHELAEIEREVEHFREQSRVNRDFLSRASSDPVLAERLALRQLRMTRPDARVVQVPRSGDNFAMSPFTMTRVEPPPPLPAYEPVAGFLTRAFLDPRRQIFLAGIGIMLVASGVILGGASRPLATSPGSPHN